MLQGNAVTDFLVLAGGAAFCAVGFVIFARLAIDLADPRRILVDRETGHVYRSQAARAGWVLLTSVIAAAGIFLTITFATDPHDMPDANRALFWLVLAFQIGWLARAVYRRYRRVT